MTDGTVVGEDGVARCPWAGGPGTMRDYHDTEWGVPVRGEGGLFERMCLEGFQAGLSWSTILNKRPAFREVFHDFDAQQVAEMTEVDVERLLGDARIIRHRGKIEATIQNARATLALDQPLDELLWSFAPPPRDDSPTSFAEVPATTPESTAMSKQLRKLGFRFVGPTTMYALMQAAGMVDDHVAGCFRSNAARHVEEAAAAVRA